MKSILLITLSLAFIGLLNAQNVVTAQPNVSDINHIKTTSLAPVPVNPNTTTTTTTTTEPPTPSTLPPTPEPVPDPESWTGSVEYNDTTCIKVKFSIQVMVTYNTTSGATEKSGFDVPSHAEVDKILSYCSSDKKPLESLSITFANKTNANLTLLFNRTADNQTVFLQSIDLSFNLTEQLFPQSIDSGKNVKASNDKLELFKVASVHSYTCAKALSAPLKTNSTTGILDVQIYFTDSKVEAFMQKDKKGVWDSEIDCKTSEISDVVPIAVGAALAGLVVIVLIAYFIGRRRSRRLAYQSV